MLWLATCGKGLLTIHQQARVVGHVCHKKTQKKGKNLTRLHGVLGIETMLTCLHWEPFNGLGSCSTLPSKVSTGERKPNGSFSLMANHSYNKYRFAADTQQHTQSLDSNDVIPSSIQGTDGRTSRDSEKEACFH
jgi:hypothetical protein